MIARVQFVQKHQLEEEGLMVDQQYSDDIRWIAGNSSCKIARVDLCEETLKKQCILLPLAPAWIY